MTDAEFDDLRDKLRAEFAAAAGNTTKQADIKATFDALTPIQNAMILQDLAQRAARLTALSGSLRQSINRIQNQVDNFLLAKLNSLQAEVDAGAGGGGSPSASAGGAAASAKPATKPTASGSVFGSGTNGSGASAATSSTQAGTAKPTTITGSVFSGASIPVDLAALQAPHARFSNSVRWNLTPTGLSIDGASPENTGGDPSTVKRVWETFRGPIEASAAEFRVPVELIIATICTESSGDPNAIRFEPGYESDDATPGKVSPGLMQTLISTARSAMNDKTIDRQWLFVPANSIKAGTAYIASQVGQTKLDPPVVACAYNAGSVKENTGDGNRWKMRQFPIGTSAHADRFVGWFNDCFRLFTPATRPPTSFYRLINK